MTRPQIEDKGAGLQISRVAANTLKKHLQKSQQGVILKFGFWAGIQQLLAVQKTAHYEMFLYAKDGIILKRILRKSSIRL
jgi:hypothetical protein